MSASTEFAASLPFFSYRQRNALIDNFFTTPRAWRSRRRQEGGEAAEPRS